MARVDMDLLSVQLIVLQVRTGIFDIYNQTCISLFFCLLYRHTYNDAFDDFPKISDDSSRIVQRQHERFRTFS